MVFGMLGKKVRSHPQFSRFDRRQLAKAGKVMGTERLLRLMGDPKILVKPADNLMPVADSAKAIGPDAAMELVAADAVTPSNLRHVFGWAFLNLPFVDPRPPLSAADARKVIAHKDTDDMNAAHALSVARDFGVNNLFAAYDAGMRNTASAYAAISHTYGPEFAKEFSEKARPLMTRRLGPGSPALKLPPEHFRRLCTHPKLDSWMEARLVAPEVKDRGIDRAMEFLDHPLVTKENLFGISDTLGMSRFRERRVPWLEEALSFVNSKSVTAENMPGLLELLKKEYLEQHTIKGFIEDPKTTPEDIPGVLMPALKKRDPIDVLHLWSCPKTTSENAARLFEAAGIGQDHPRDVEVAWYHPRTTIENLRKVAKAISGSDSETALWVWDHPEVNEDELHDLSAAIKTYADSKIPVREGREGLLRLLHKHSRALSASPTHISDSAVHALAKGVPAHRIIDYQEEFLNRRHIPTPGAMLKYHRVKEPHISGPPKPTLYERASRRLSSRRKKG